jgi:hypothetical protein
MYEEYRGVEDLLEVSIDPTNQSVNINTNIKDINILNAKLDIVILKVLSIIELIKFDKWDDLRTELEEKIKKEGE